MTLNFIVKLIIACVIALSLALLSNFLGNLIIPANNHQTINAKNAKQTTTANEAIEESSSIKIKNSDNTLSANLGKKVAKKCVSCHSLKKAGKNKVGPNLYNIINRNRAMIADYNYSNAIREMGGRWSVVDLNKYIKNPKKFMPGTKMSFKGIKRKEDRISLIFFLNQLSDNPINLSNELK